ncbi:hypothetical protein [uncultured Mucilaginibacter sp.]|uniref:alpha/beta hydrolase n=1 Tax=uncultured Mucilaginibacter sp. TaxID=797541 RepID=UPI0025DEE411|nr:hypothetical protein [uncultured Mucilaginibacter sp.]
MILSTNQPNPTALQEDFVLKYLVNELQPAAGKKKALILMHGVGGNEQNMFNLSGYFPDDLLLVSARGPNTLGSGRYAWFEVDFSTGNPVIKEQQEAESRDLIRQFIRQVKQKYTLEDVYLGGFSQGAIMSCSVGLTAPETVKGIIAMSGRILQQIRPSVQPNPVLAGLNIFVAHGLHDSVLPIAYGREAKTYLESLNVRLTYHEYPIAHQITAEEMADVAAWMG